jgi:hypothetical protein
LNGWTVCRFHGARGGAPKGNADGSYKHGLYTKEAKAVCRLVSDLLAQDDRKHRMNEKARPGGNITGETFFTSEQNGHRSISRALAGCTLNAATN